MISWFPGDGNAQDILSNALDLSVSGVTFPAGKVAQAFDFDGTGDVTYSSINAGGAYTVDFWLRPTRSGGFENLISRTYTDGTQNYGQLYFVNDRIDYWQGGGARIQSVGGSVPQNTYTHVALTYDGSVNRLYLNGNLAGTSAVHAGETFNNQIRLGNHIGGTGTRFIGQLDEIEIFNRVLSQTEIRGIFNADSEGKCKTDLDLFLAGAVSRKMHGGLGPFDIPLPVTGAPGVECRSSGANHTLVFTFTNDVVSGNASVTSGTGVAGSPTFAGKNMTVNLSGVADVQNITVTLSSVTDNFAQILPDTAVSMNLLIGDTNGNKTVNGTDVSQTRLRSGFAVGAANFRSDVNASGGISGTDVSIVKLRSGSGLP